MFPLNFPSNYLQVYKSKDSNLFKTLLKLNTLDFLGKFGKLQIQKQKTRVLKVFQEMRLRFYLLCFQYMHLRNAQPTITGFWSRHNLS